MKKKYLLSYKPSLFDSLSSYTYTYYLIIETVWFWGLFRSIKECAYRVPGHHQLRDYFDHWDKLIADKTPLKK